ncbi:alpha/beta fold hydrolase [Algirhabdus cladophorae]|uniref:alpha/beta fold hydrolase n=1 Tax=Algirhabdus cladophorae TaxID=3377108 RepID=UPI003B84A19B
MVLGLVFLLLVMAVAPVVLEMLRLPMNDGARKDAPGLVIDLPQGRTHIRWDGPEDGPVLVAVHGLTTPSFVFDAMIPGLVAQGYRVLRYDHLGRGFSDSFEVAQTAAFFTNHLKALLDQQGLDQDLTLLGYSMGGSVVTAFAQAHPKMVRRVILLAPAGIDYPETNVAKCARTLPLVGDWLMETVGRYTLRRDLLNQRQNRIEVGGVVDKQLDEFKRRGYLRAVLSSMRGILADEQEEAHQDVSRHVIPLVAIWADGDTVIPVSGMAKLAKWNHRAQQDIIKGAGHDVAYTHPVEVVDAIRKLTR